MLQPQHCSSNDKHKHSDTFTLTHSLSHAVSAHVSLAREVLLENRMWNSQTRLGQNDIGSARAQLLADVSLVCFAFAVLCEASCNKLRLYPAAVPTASRITPGNNLSTQKNRCKGLPLAGHMDHTVAGCTSCWYFFSSICYTRFRLQSCMIRTFPY